MRETEEILLDLIQRLQADKSVKVNLSDLIEDLEFNRLYKNVGDEE